MKSFPVVLLALAMLSACSTTSDAWLDHQVTSSTVGAAPSLNREVPLHMAWAQLTTLGQSPISIRVLSAEGSEIQQIVYPATSSLPGENMLIIERSANANLRLSRAPSAAALQTEMAQALPDIRMTVDPIIRINAFGPYGTASGTSEKGERCIYAWQQVKIWSGSAKDTSAKVRLRYCDRNMDMAQLANLLSGFSTGMVTTGGMTGPPVASGQPDSILQERQLPTVKHIHDVSGVQKREETAKTTPAAAVVPLPAS
ncbi:cellulose biosynthesis protein BcsN [Rhizobium sp. FKY42]|uniref:cellulose biosynthesis protein BcsN n=1 Tax=Rhizobium sp. FKY42 TaxID=2562310 RepID=UPI0010C0FA43|nr:cellulose biosynthesis protein BcsN [Rhizobium sp. FKY42]